VLRNIQNAHFEGRLIGVDLRSPDFVALARAFGFESERVSRLRNLLRRFRER
jgi:thiamine pyrophosphate-dependent acetolactate synthase large subunit-like protein